MNNEVMTVTVKGIGDFSNVVNEVKGIQGAFNSLKLNSNLVSDFSKEFGNLQKLLDNYRKAMDKPVGSKKDLKNLEALEKAINSSFSTLNKLYGELNGQTILTKVDSSKLDELKEKTNGLRDALQEAFSNVQIGKISGISAVQEDMEKAVARSKTLKESFQEAFSGLKSGDVSQFTKQIDNAFENLSTKLNKGKLTTTADNLISTLQKLGLVSVDIETKGAQQKIDALKEGFNNLKTAVANGASGEEIKGLIDKINAATEAERNFLAEASKRGNNNYREQAEGARELADGVKEATAANREFKQQSLSAAQQVEQLQQSTQYFFGLRNMINLLKRGIREAVDTIKELDAAMTETAVVTNFSVGDMWEKLPEYTANANALGATVQDMYEATTLYYQQGLNAQQAMSIASETMKMARIGGLEAAEATDMMTAALRGFNMELNETSAQRINDVYSNLAAKTASNTEELGTAMQRTASIAASAGMSFEGTAAFLAQAIETTREPAENLGTAMKTIVARFQELKKNPLEMQDVDGEAVDYNKVDAALKTIGVDLKDTNGQFRDLDKVFLDISQRWDTLTQTQQRYIATTAAGSRQQSRFIAMMSNYDRTMELMGYAKDSEGASDEQFGKTLDSLEAKINKFQNAWKQFLMNIMNDSWTKGIVTGATKVLDIVNKLINTLSFGGEAKGIKSFLSLFTAFTALKYTGRGVNMLIGGLGGMLDPKSTAREGFRGGAIGGQAAKITSPIVQAINSLIPHIDKAAMPLQYKGYGDFKGARKELMGQFNPLTAKRNGLDAQNKYSFSGLLTTFGKYGVDAKQQNAILASVPGLKHNMAKSLGKILQESGASPEATKGLIAGFKNGSYSTAQVLEKAGLVKSFASQMAAIGEESGPEAAKKFMESERQAIIKEQGRDVVAKGKSSGVSDLKTYFNDEVDKRLQARVYGTDKGREALSQERELTGAEKAANTFGALGGALTSAGMSLQMFGSALSATNPMLGQLATTMGTVLTTAGSIPNMISSLIAGGPAVWAITAAVGALAATLGALKIRNDRIKKSAEKVKDTFEETNKQTQNNISTLKQYREQMATFAKGVDSNGNNVNLSDEDYAQYLEMVDKIAELNPKIVQGYNAQGHAIIDNNKALEETIRLQEEQQKKAIDVYTSEDSLQKLINARNIDKNYKKGTQTTVDTDFLVQHRTSRIENLAGIPNLQTKKAPMQTAVAKVLAEMQNQDNLKVDEILKGYNITLEQLTAGEAAAINTFVKNQDQINAQVGAQVGSDMKESLTNAFTNLSEETAAFDEAVAPVVQNLQTYISNLPAFKDIGSEFQSALMTGLKDIAIQPDLDASQMQSQAQLLIQEFDNLTRKGGDYATAMESVEEAQNQFASSLDASEYARNTEDALETLNSLLKEYEGNTTAYGQAVSEYLQSQINKIQSFTEKGSESLTEALNKRMSEVAAAEGTYKAFQDATKSDLSTGKESMKSIYDEITKDTSGVKLHLQGSGDNTLWTGLSSIFSTDAVDKAAEEGTEAVQRMLNRIKPMLQDGQAGFNAFWKDMFSDENYKKLEKIEGVTMDKDKWEIHWDDNLNPDVFKEMADALGYSDQFLASMLNSGRQFADLNFMNIQDVRKALSTDMGVIKGTSTSTITNDDGSKETVTDMFLTEDYLKNALKDANIVNPKEQKEYINNILKNGVKIIPGPKDITEDTFQHMGISDLPGLIRTLGDTGQFDRSQIAEYAQRMSDLGIDFYTEQGFDTLYKDYLDSQEHPELPTINSIDSHVASIEHMIASQTGVVSQEDKDAYEQANKDVYGELGKADSIPELFSKGLNKNGEKLTQQEYDKTVDLLNEMSSTYRKQADFFDKQAIKAEENGNFTDAEWFRKHAEGYRTKADVVDDYKGKGAEAFEPATTLDKAYEAINKQYAQGKTPFEFLKGNTLEQAAKVIDKNTEILQKQQFDKSPEGVQQGRQQAINDSLAKTSPIGTDDRAKTINEQTKLNSQFIKKMLQQNLDAALADGLEGLNPREIAADPKRNSALLHMYQDIMEHTMPKPEDLEALGFGDNPLQYFGTDWASDVNSKVQLAQQSREEAINEAYLNNLNTNQPSNSSTVSSALQERQEILNQANEDQNAFIRMGEEALAASEYSPGGLNMSASMHKITGTFLVNVGEFIQNWNNGTAELESNIDTNTTGTDKITKSITDLGTRLKNWWDKIHGIESDNPPSQPATYGPPKPSTSSQSNTPQQTEVPKYDIDTSPGDGKLTDLQTKIQDTNKEVEGTHTYTVSVNDSGLSKAGKDAAKITKASSKTNVIKTVADTPDLKKVDAARKSIESKESKIPIGVKNNTASGMASIRSGLNLRTAYIPVKVEPLGSTTITVKAVAKGMNNYGFAPALPSVGSAARGGYGRLGPKGKGGMTLTGELGYEIAWIPSENRSMILGANGPQMIDLPRDAVVWTHEQSKKIMKQKSIPAGSQEGGSYIPTDSTGGGGGNKSKGKSGKSGKGSNTNKAVTTAANKVTGVAGRVLVWWENMARKVDATQKKIDKNQSDLEKTLKKFGTTRKSVQTLVANYRKNLQTSINLNKQEITRANNELRYLKRGDKAANKFYSAKEVSYEVTKKDKKGKTTKETKTKKVDLKNFITQVNGVWQIDQGQINKIAKTNQSLAQAIKDAAEKAIGEELSRIKTAEDNIKKAQEALEKLSNDIYETFDRWEKSINQVYVLSQKLQLISGQLATTGTKLDLQFSKLEAGAIKATTAQQEVINGLLDQQRQELLNKAQASREDLSAKKQAYTDSLTLQPYISNVLKNPDSTEAKNDLAAAKKAMTFLNMAGLGGSNFDYNKAINYLNQQGMSKDEYDAIKGVLDGIFEKQNDYLGAQEAAYSSLNEIYQQMSEYQSFIADFEESLLSGIEAQAEDEIKRLDKLNSSLTKAYKEILDEVKNKLDERRKKEDNEKTESDIAKKQQRLATLRADTSGGHAVEIAQLEKEISDAQRDYQRSLEDQLIERLQHQNDLAEKQRQQQIDLLQAHVDVAKSTDTNLAQVKEWLAHPDQYYDEIRSAWLSNKGYDNATPEQQARMEHEWETEWAKYQGYSEQLKKYEEMYGSLQDIEKLIDKILASMPGDTSKPKYTAADMKAMGYSAKALRATGQYSAKDLRNAGYTGEEIKKGGYSAADFKAAGFTAEEALKAGYSGKEVAKAYGGAAALRAGVSGKDVQAGAGWVAATVQKSIRDNSKDKDVSQTDMSGVSVKIDTNGKGKGGVVSGTITKSGKYAYANDGSTLYGQAWNPDTGKLTGKVSKTTIDKLDVKHIQATKEAKEALIYAIQHMAPGAVINKKFKALAEAAGIVGKKYKLSNKIWGSIGSTGEIVYNKGKEGVYLWNPATGKQKFEKYNEATFKKKAKYKTVGSEYADVLKANGIKKFATGGLASSTGPAWLDGTPSKPELVLNAQDTKNFIALRDVLNNLMKSDGSFGSAGGGDTIYEVNINVDKIASDYDVDKMAERVKKIIVKDASYRNVTQVRRLR